ncbi:MAG: hypothetical protein SWH68_09670 [Thermodesulfobacteriota bacterium]|nr:hypothetical protein [Thermodesulfobacteriota bacterium]
MTHVTMALRGNLVALRKSSPETDMAGRKRTVGRLVRTVKGASALKPH